MSIYKSQYAISLVGADDEIVRYQPGNRVLFISPGALDGKNAVGFLPGQWHLNLCHNSTGQQLNFVQRRFRSKIDAETFLQKYFPQIAEKLEKSNDDKF